MFRFILLLEKGIFFEMFKLSRPEWWLGGERLYATNSGMDPSNVELS